MVYFSSAWRCSSAFSDCTVSPPRNLSMAASIFFLSPPAARKATPSGLASSAAASTNHSLAMKASPCCWASLSVWLSRRLRSLPIDRLPSCPDTLGRVSSASPRRSRSAGTLTPDCDSSGRVLPPLWSSKAASTCTGSMMLWSRPTASDCASASACWNREVSLSIRMRNPLNWWPAFPAIPCRCGWRAAFQGWALCPRPWQRAVTPPLLAWRGSAEGR